MSEYSKLVILCEDRQQEVFARHFLVSCGVNPHRIYTDVCPSGQQAAEQYVRQKYPRSVISYRQIASHMAAGLVVLIDADRLTVVQRLKSMEDELTIAGVPSRSPEERIGIFIPKRNIETWIYYLKGTPVNEDDEYRHLQNAGECKPYVENLARSRHQPLPDEAPPSLVIACTNWPG
jgi:hypothetical protein